MCCSTLRFYPQVNSRPRSWGPGCWPHAQGLSAGPSPKVPAATHTRGSHPGLAPAPVVAAASDSLRYPGLHLLETQPGSGIGSGRSLGRGVTGLAFSATTIKSLPPPLWLYFSKSGSIENEPAGKKRETDTKMDDETHGQDPENLSGTRKNLCVFL